MTNIVLAAFGLALLCPFIWDKGLRNAIFLGIMLFSGFYFYDTSPKGSGVIAALYQELRETLG